MIRNLKPFRKTVIALGALAAVIMLGFSGSTQTLAADTLPADYPVSSPIRVSGTIYHDGDRFTLKNIQGDTVQDEIILNISDETKILDAVNGFPVSASDVKDGETVYAYISQAMTMSIPPQSHAELILCRIPQDFAVPSYETVQLAAFLTPDQTGKSVNIGQIATVRGNVWAVMEETTLLPYLTRNIVTTDDLTEGTRCLIWPAQTGSFDNVRAAGKIVIFPKDASAK